MIDFIKTSTFFKHLVLVLLVLILFFWGTLKLVGNYTKHGETTVVPDLTGLTPAQVENVIQKNDLRYLVIDSVYEGKVAKGTVVEQNPSAGFKVKENRMIYITIKATQAQRIKMPNLIDVSLRQATAILETYGLMVGRLSYEPDFAKNAVLKQMMKGKIIKPGDLVSKGDKIDLVLGDGLSNEKVDIPYLNGLVRSEAIAVLNSASLNIGALIYDETVKDTMAAKVYKQNPSYLAGKTISQGSSVDLFFTQSASKLNHALDSIKSSND